MVDTANIANSLIYPLWVRNQDPLRTHSCHACDGPLPQVDWLIDWFIHSCFALSPGWSRPVYEPKIPKYSWTWTPYGAIFWLSPMFVYIYLLSQTAAKWPKKDHFGKIFSPPQFPLKIFENIHGGGTIVYPQHMDRLCCHLFISTHKPW